MTQKSNVDKVAQLLNLSVPQIYNLVNGGTLPKSVDGTWDLAVCANSYIKYLQGRSGTEKENYNTERTRLTKAQADKVELEIGILRADVIPSGVVRDVVSAALSAMRARLIGVPTRLAAVCAGLDRISIESESRALVHEALMELSDVDSDLYSAARARASGTSGLLVGGDPSAGSNPESVGGAKPTVKRRGQRGAGAVLDG